MNRLLALCSAAAVGAAVWAGAIAPLEAQRAADYAEADDARAALAAARQQQRDARARAQSLEQRSRQSNEAAQKATEASAALAARVQQSEAEMAVAEAELLLVARQSAALDRRLAQRRQPLVRLTAALQTMARRPLVLSALQPGSLSDVVHTRAVLASAVPVVRQRTAGLRAELERAQALEDERRAALTDLRDAEAALGARRSQLVALASRERAAALRASGGANREEERALALSEEARDLDALVGKLDEAGSLRQRLAALPGPVLRPAQPGAASQPAQAPAPAPTATAPPDRYQLPVTGRVVSGFGAESVAGARTSGVSIAPRPAALVVAPGRGRVAFAGPYRGYGTIVIVEHPNGWTSLITGLSRVDVSVGQAIMAGSPLGQASATRPQISLELRRDGDPVNPLDHLR